MDLSQFGDFKVERVDVTLDNGKEVTCQVHGKFSVDDKEYALLFPEDGRPFDFPPTERSTIIYGLEPIDGEYELRKIESKTEYKKAANYFYSMYDD